MFKAFSKTWFSIFFSAATLAIVCLTAVGDDQEYPETAQGKIITFGPVEARYIRAWVGGSTANEWSHWVGIQAFFTGHGQTVKPARSLPVTWGEMKSP